MPRDTTGETLKMVDVRRCVARQSLIHWDSASLPSRPRRGRRTARRMLATNSPCRTATATRLAATSGNSLIEARSRVCCARRGTPSGQLIERRATERLDEQRLDCLVGVRRRSEPYRRARRYLAGVVDRNSGAIAGCTAGRSAQTPQVSSRSRPAATEHDPRLLLSASSFPKLGSWR